MGANFWSLLFVKTLTLTSYMPVISGVAIIEKKIHIEKRQAILPKSGLTEEERRLFLEAHNKRRARVVPPASNMQRMFYSSELEKAAQAWANKCVWDHGQPDISKNKYKELGQNLYAGGNNISSIVNAWDKEKASYNFENNTCSGTCGHYTQVVWSNSYVLGCGMTYCKDMKAYYAVCNYYAGGNYKGQRPYVSGASCSQCPMSAAVCGENMCGGLNCSEVEPNCTVIDNENCFCGASDYKITSVAVSKHLDNVIRLLAILISFLLP